MCRRLHLTLLMMLLGGCLQGPGSVLGSSTNSRPAGEENQDGSLAAALVVGDEELVQTLTRDIIAGKRDVTEAALRDVRPIPSNVLLRTTYRDRDYQLGVNTVSEYMLCALQIRHQTSSENILQAIAPELRGECSKLKPCEVCNAQTFPVAPEIENHLIEYWTAKRQQLAQ